MSVWKTDSDDKDLRGFINPLHIVSCEKKGKHVHVNLSDKTVQIIECPSPEEAVRNYRGIRDMVASAIESPLVINEPY
jgi:hypothetical protein